ncbi:MAG: hypothetical protein HYW22_02125 [Candidatus Aenigmarchaeota archaeon]|nr:hypothetical protein [Candidatus Aenigmarchaeota archaeon]
MVIYPPDEIEPDVDHLLRSMLDSLEDEIGILEGIERGLSYNHLPLGAADYNSRYRKWKDIAYQTAVGLVAKFPDQKDKVRKLVDRAYGLKDVQLPE